MLTASVPLEWEGQNRPLCSKWLLCWVPNQNVSIPEARNVILYKFKLLKVYTGTKIIIFCSMMYSPISLFKTDWGKPMGAAIITWERTAYLQLCMISRLSVASDLESPSAVLPPGDTWRRRCQHMKCSECRMLMLPLRHSKQVMSGAGVGAKWLQGIVSYLWSAWIE